VRTIDPRYQADRTLLGGGNQRRHHRHVPGYRYPRRIASFAAFRAGRSSSARMCRAPSPPGQNQPWDVAARDSSGQGLAASEDLHLLASSLVDSREHPESPGLEPAQRSARSINYAFRCSKPTIQQPPKDCRRYKTS
jgi:hypothetical protein